MKLRKALAVMLAAVMVFSLSCVAFAAGEGYEITNPYENINWESVNSYKTALHTHTNQSDGDMTVKQSLERHAATGFDIVALTDHGTVNYTWTDDSSNKLIHGALALVGKSEGDLDWLDESGTFDGGESYTVTTENGDDYLNTASGARILRVPFGIENNAVSVNAHVNSWFVDYHDNTVTQYIDAISSVDRLGGVCVINHPGEYTKARYELYSDSAYNEDNPAYAYYIDLFASLLDKYDACIGIDMNSKGDNRTRFDRILWDKLLTRFAAKGENVYGICSSDAHQLRVIDTGYVQLLAESLTSEAAENALRNGEFFGASHCLGNPDELYEIAAALKEFYGENELYSKVYSSAVSMTERVAAIENGELDADEDIGITYETLDGNGFETVGKDPKVTGIRVENSTITVESENSLLVRFISDGRLIATVKADSGSICLDDFADDIGDYVRAEVFGEGGMVYVQPFLINASEKTDSPVTSKGFFRLGFLDFLLAEINNLKSILIRFFANLF